MVAFTHAMIGSLLVQWDNKMWQYKVADLSSWASCLSLYHLQQPLLAFSLAIGYTVWNFLPGSLADINLPSHASFMRNLTVRKNKAEEGE